MVIRNESLSEKNNETNIHVYVLTNVFSRACRTRISLHVDIRLVRAGFSLYKCTVTNERLGSSLCGKILISLRPVTQWLVFHFVSKHTVSSLKAPTVTCFRQMILSVVMQAFRCIQCTVTNEFLGYSLGGKILISLGFVTQWLVFHFVSKHTVSSLKAPTRCYLL